MTEDYLEEDNIKVLLNYYSNWPSTTVIHTYFDSDLKSNTTIKINSITLNNYVRTFVHVKRQFYK